MFIFFIRKLLRLRSGVFDIQLDKLSFSSCELADPSHVQGSTCTERKRKQKDDQKPSLKAQDLINDLPSVDDHDYVYQTTILGQLNENFVLHGNDISPCLEEASESLALLEESIWKRPTFSPECASSQRKKRAESYKKFQTLSSFKATFNLEAITEEGDTESSDEVADSNGLVFVNKF